MCFSMAVVEVIVMVLNLQTSGIALWRLTPCPTSLIVQNVKLLVLKVKRTLPSALSAILASALFAGINAMLEKNACVQGEKLLIFQIPTKISTTLSDSDEDSNKDSGGGGVVVRVGVEVTIELGIRKDG
ncbi:hypothetical protein AKJ16_DCAP13555 [Drosera capensis]